MWQRIKKTNQYFGHVLRRDWDNLGKIIVQGNVDQVADRNSAGPMEYRSGQVCLWLQPTGQLGQVEIEIHHQKVHSWSIRLSGLRWWQVWATYKLTVTAFNDDCYFFSLTEESFTIWQHAPPHVSQSPSIRPDDQLTSSKSPPNEQPPSVSIQYTSKAVAG